MRWLDVFWRHPEHADKAHRSTRFRDKTLTFETTGKGWQGNPTWWTCLDSRQWPEDDVVQLVEFDAASRIGHLESFAVKDDFNHYPAPAEALVYAGIPGSDFELVTRGCIADPKVKRYRRATLGVPDLSQQGVVEGESTVYITGRDQDGHGAVELRR